MKQSFLPLISIVLLSGCLFTPDPTEEEPFSNLITPLPAYGSSGQSAVSNSASAQKSYLALGDFYSLGGGASQETSWPHQLAALLREKGFQIGNPQVIAQEDWTAEELFQALAGREVGRHSMVSILIGVNDQLEENNTEEFKTYYKKLLNASILFAGGDTTNVFAVTIPDWSITPYAASLPPEKVKPSIEAFNTIIKEEAKAVNITVVDITPLSARASSDSTLVSPEGPYFTASMYRYWADATYPVANEILR